MGFRLKECFLVDQGRLSCKVLAKEGYLARILEEEGYLARILQSSCKITISKILSKKQKQITEIRCKIKTN